MHDDDDPWWRTNDMKVFFRTNNKKKTNSYLQSLFFSVFSEKVLSSFIRHGCRLMGFFLRKTLSRGKGKNTLARHAGVQCFRGSSSTKLPLVPPMPIASSYIMSRTIRDSQDLHDKSAYQHSTAIHIILLHLHQRDCSKCWNWNMHNSKADNSWSRIGGTTGFAENLKRREGAYTIQRAIER